MSSSSALPPPGNLPAWSRVSAFDRSRYPRPFLRDRKAPTGMGDMDTSVDVKFLEKMTQSVQHQLLNHDKSIKFLQDQHAETLQKLHQELEALKRENKELKFRVIVAQNTDTLADAEDHRSQSVPSDIKTIVLQEEIKDLHQALKESTNKNAELRRTVISLQSSLNEKTDADTSSANTTPRKSHRRKFSVSNLSMSLPLNATLNPLQIRDTVDGVARVPSAAECEFIIEQLHNINRQQLAELSRLRANRQTMQSPRSLTPEPVTKSLDDTSTASTIAMTKLPRIPMRPKFKKPARSSSSNEMGAPLPPVVNSLSASVVEIRKRHNKTNRNEPVRKY